LYARAKADLGGGGKNCLRQKEETQSRHKKVKFLAAGVIGKQRDPREYSWCKIEKKGLGENDREKELERGQCFGGPY